MGGMENLLTEPWLVELTESERGVYAGLRRAEAEFLERCKQAGCTVLGGPRRQSLVLVPLGTVLPALDERVYAAWRYVLQAAALRQGKHATIGARSSLPPRWFAAGDWVAQCPPARALRVTGHTNRAARGARITAQEAIDYLKGRVKALGEAMANSERAGQKSRVGEQRERLQAMQGHLEAALAAVERARVERRQVSAQLMSGVAWKLRAVLDDGSAWTFSVPSIGLLGVVDGVQVGQASTRRREVVGEVIDLGPLRLRLV